MSNPYSHSKDFQFWSRSISWPARGAIDPVTNSFCIRKEARVSTLGSCFAQHISKYLQSVGCTYYTPETASAEMGPNEILARNYGVFSARYGNVYTVKQAVQLFERAFGKREPKEVTWTQGNRYVDPFRPQIEPGGFATVEEVVSSRAEHFRYVRDVFLNSDVIVFTLGLTEAWRDRRDGSVFPLAPGVSGGSFDPSIHEFINFGIDEVREDLFAFYNLVKSVNKKCQIILTVSPVPLIATYENRSALVSTVYSKSVLRVAADELERKYTDVFYFPSYELITSPATAGFYFQDDFRQVKEEGVQHVMRVFAKHFIREQQSQQERIFFENIPKMSQSGIEVVCDEETIERSLMANRKLKGSDNV